MQARDGTGIDRLVATGPEAIRNDVRSDLFFEAWNAFVANPLVGYGTGSASFETLTDAQAGAHNQVLALLVQYGIVGLFIIVGLLIAVLVTPRSDDNYLPILMVILLIVLSFFSHVLLSQWNYAIAIALVGSGILSSRMHRTNHASSGEGQ